MRQLDHSDTFTDKLLNVTFELHEQLSNCYSRRNREHKELDRFVDGLSKIYQRNMMQLRHQQRKELENVSITLQKSTQDHLDFLVKEQHKLKQR